MYLFTITSIVLNNLFKNILDYLYDISKSCIKLGKS